MKDRSINGEISDVSTQHTIYLQAVRKLIQDGQNFEDDIFNLVDVLSQVLCDQIPDNRKLAMDLLCELIPSYRGDDLDTNIGLLFPQLLQNLLHHQLNVKKSVLQVLHVYYRHTKDISHGLQHLIDHGINTDLKAVRNEVLVSIPALMSTGFAASQLDRLVISIINCLNLIGNGESILPVTLCLEHLRNIIGENEFDIILDQLDPSLSNLYRAVVQNPTYTWEGSQKQTSNQMADIIPNEILNNLDSEKSWQTRSDAINDLFTFVSQTMDNNSLLYFCRRILDYISLLVDDANFNVALVSMNILHQIIIRTSEQVKVHMDLIIQILLKKLSDGKLIMRKINLRIALSLMHSLSPMVFLKSIFPILKNKSSRVREEILNMIIAALLSFPSSEFNLVLLPDDIAFTLLDNRKRVRHASLECFAILAQQLGPGNLSPLVSAVDILERKNKNAEGLLLAVQSRLGRKMLPKINENELVQYAVKLPTSKSTDGQLKPDVAWIISGMSVSGYESSRSEMSDYSESCDRRILSAGRNKLPWQENQKLSTRKNAASAPVRAGGLSQSRSPEEPSPVICDSWVSDPANEKRVPANGSNMPVSYFELYKNKMKKLKEAGLRADVHTVNMELNLGDRSSSKEDILSPLEDDSLDDSFTEAKTSPIPVKPTLARSASKKRKDRALTDRKTSSDDMNALRSNKDLVNLNNANLAHTLPKMKGGLSHLISEATSPTNSPSQNPPFPMRRATIHRTPSGNARSSPRMAELSNLTRLKPLSKSSPETHPLNKVHLQNGTGSNYAEDQSYDRRNSNNKDETRRQTRRRNSIDRRYADDVQRGSYLRNGEEHQRNDDIAYSRDFFAGPSGYVPHENNIASSKENQQNQPGTPKLAKSAQEKLRKLKEEQQRLSANKHRNGPSSGSNGTFPHKLHLELNNNHSDQVIERHSKQHFQEPPFAKKSSKLRHNNSFTSSPSPTSPQRPYQGGNANEFIKSPLSPLSDRLTGNPDDRPIKPAKQQYWGNRNGNHSPHEQPSQINGDERAIKPAKHQHWGEASAESPGSLDGVDGLQIEGHKPKVQKVQKVQPKFGTSPKLKRKTNRKTSPRQQAEDKENLIEANKTDLQNMKPFEAVTIALGMLNSSPEEWESKIDGLDMTLELLKKEGDDLCEGHAVVTAILNQVKNLRSQITRKALNCIGQAFVHAPRTCEPDLEAILKTVLPKAGDTNQFIKSDTEQAIELLVENVNPYKAMPALVSCGVAHLNGHVRKISSKALADISERIGYAKFCSQRGNLMAAAKLAQDQHPESRYHGRRIMLQLLEYPELMDTLKRQLKPANFKAVHDIIENLKLRGLEPASGSATLRRSMRGSAPHNSPSTTRSRKR
ncbi:TOG array regulator of axonemal microtubules protein 1-like [Clytia hemisphaerica]|uniref:TOG domain-containing protein n=1 Tax=Clytia hemisphaerica TaxID=252671 RepID=A0A7M5UA79_9CNID